MSRFGLRIGDRLRLRRSLDGRRAGSEGAICLFWSDGKTPMVKVRFDRPNGTLDFPLDTQELLPAQEAA